MKGFGQNRFWSAVTILAAAGFIIALALFWWTKGNFDTEREQYTASMANLRQLESSDPYPSAANVRDMKAHFENYRRSLNNLKTELMQHVVPITPLPPNEFQMHLRESRTAVVANARIHGVKLPENFHLGFNEFVSALPSTVDAPKFGQELAQIQLLLNIIIEARVDAIRMFRRVPKEASMAPSAAPTPRAGAGATAPKPFERNTVEFGVSGSPIAVRRVINEIASANEQFFIMRSLHVKNQKDKGPPRETAPENAPSPTPFGNAPQPSASPAAISALNFIVGNEHLDMSARVEMLNFAP